MKKIILGMGFLMVFSSLAQADSDCGGRIISNNDCNKNPKKYSVSCCPEFYRGLGFAYTDLSDQDNADAVSLYCLSPTNEASLSSDFTKKPKEFVCDYNERLAGIYAKDVMTSGGKMKDSLDGVTALCQKPGDGAIRRVDNKDLQGGREGQQILAPKDTQIVGIAYKEINKGESDQADCVTLIVK